MISSEVSRVQYTLSGSGQVLPITFAFLLPADVGAISTIAGVDTTLVLNTDYTISGGGTVPATGNLTMVAGAAGTIITIYRTVPLTQTTQLTTNGPFPAKTIETTLDRLVMEVQRVGLLATQALKFPVSNMAPADVTALARASKVLGFDSSGNLTYYAFVAGVIVPQSVQGTADQVLVNGTSGTPTTGAITLTLPQSIGITSVVRFGRMGINGAAAANSDLVISRLLPNATGQASVVVQGSLTPPAATDLHPNAFRDLTSFTPTAAGDAYASYDAQSSMGGSVALNHYHGYQARHGFIGSGTLGILSGFATTNMGLSGVGTITFMRGLYVSNASIGGGGTVGQFDGIYMDNLTNATGAVNAMYIAGPNNIFMAGGQFGNSALLTFPAGATTCRGYFTFDQASQTGLAVMNSNATATGTMISFCRDGGSVQGSVTQVNNTTVAYNTSSDSRLKENVRDYTESGAIFDALKPRVFDWRWGGKDSHGFIAQELREVYPEAVSVGTDEINADGTLLHPWGVDLGKLMPIVIAEVKGLRARINQLEAVVQP